jgi:hypothetical protein
MDENVRRLGGPVAGPPHPPLHAFDKLMGLAQFLELFRCELQPGALDQNREALG